MAAIVIVFIAEYILALPPCNLCLYQRFPYYALIFITILMILLQATAPNIYKLYVLAVLLITFASTALAVFHLSVENGWIVYKSSCAANLASANAIELLQENIKYVEIRSCHIPKLKFLGISVAGWNSLYSLFLVMVSTRLLVKITNIRNI